MQLNQGHTATGRWSSKNSGPDSSDSKGYALDNYVLLSLSLGLCYIVIFSLVCPLFSWWYISSMTQTVHAGPRTLAMDAQ